MSTGPNQRTWNRRAGLVAVMLLLSLIVSACGTAADTPTAVPAPTATTAPVAAPTDTTAPPAAVATDTTAPPAAVATDTTAPAAAATDTTAPAAAATDTAAPAGTSAPIATVTPNTAVSGKMSFLSWMTEANYKPLLDAFKAAYPNVTIDFQNVPPANNQYTQRLQLLAGSDSLPDLFYVQPPTTLLAKDGFLADLSDLPAVKALPAGYAASYTYNGKVYAYAPDAWVGGVFYNKDLFAKYNVSVPQTWADFVAACKTFKDAGLIPLAMGADELVDGPYWLHNTEVVSQDPTFDSKIDTGQVTFAQGYLDPLTTWKKDMIDTGYISQDMAGLSDDQRMSEFASGQAAMTISGPWAIATFKQKNPQINLGLFPFVGSTPDRDYTVGAVNVGLAINPKAQNKAAAEAFINFLGTPQGLTIYQKITGNFLGVPGVPYTIDPIMEAVRPFAVSGKFAYPPIQWSNTGTLADMMVKGVQQIVLGSTTPDQLVKDLDAKQAELSANQK